MKEGVCATAIHMVCMEGNQFAAFSFSGPAPRKPSLRRHLSPSKVVTKKGSSSCIPEIPEAHRRTADPHEEKVPRGGEGRVKRQNVADCSTGALHSRSGTHFPEGGENNQNVLGILGIQTSEKHCLSVAKVEKTEDVGDEEPGALLQMVGAIQVKEEKKEVADSLTAPLTGNSPSRTVNKRKFYAKRSSGKGEGLREEIEDCGGLICRSVDSYKLEDETNMKRRNKKGRKSGLSEVPSPPPDWEQAVQKIRIMRTGRDAPVDLLGPEQLVDTAADLETQKFHVLVAAMISSQTRDAVTAAAMKRLKAMPGGLIIQHLAKSEVLLETLEELLKPVSFYRQKAKHLKSMAEILLKPPYCGSVPRTLDELIKLPGVGPKVGLLVLWVGFGMGEVGLIVDTHVRRVSCRLGWAPEGSTAEQVREALEAWLPKSLWAELSFLFVGFGQQVCKPVAPKCEECQLKMSCPSAFKCVKKVINNKVPSKPEEDVGT